MSACKTLVGPLGEPFTLESLPPVAPGRWVVRRKAEVVTAVEGGLLTMEDACRRYGLSREEFLSWQHRYSQQGMSGLRATRVPRYRKGDMIGFAEPNPAGAIPSGASPARA